MWPSESSRKGQHSNLRRAGPHSQKRQGGSGNCPPRSPAHGNPAPPLGTGSSWGWLRCSASLCPSVRRKAQALNIPFIQETLLYPPPATSQPNGQHPAHTCTASFCLHPRVGCAPSSSMVGAWLGATGLRVGMGVCNPASRMRPLT